MHRKQYLLMLLAVTLALMLILPGTLLAQGRKGQIVKFNGEVSAVVTSPEGAVTALVVDGYDVVVTRATNVVDSQGELVDGAQVMVIGRQEEGDGPVTAIVVRVLKPREPRTEKVFVKGPIQDGILDEEGLGWIQVADTMVWIGMDTVVDGVIADAEGVLLGTYVIVRGTPTMDPEGIQAEHIRVRVPEEELECDQVIEGVISEILYGEVEEGSEEDPPIVGYVIDTGDGELVEVQIDEETKLPEDSLDVGDEVRVCVQAGEEALVALRIGRAGEDNDQPDGDEDCVPEELTFSGPIQRFPASMQGSWIVSGTHFVVSDTMIIEGFDDGVRPCIGCMAEVEAYRCGNGVPHATSIQISEPEEPPAPQTIVFEGEVVYMPRNGVGNWLVDTWKFTANHKTNIPEMPERGDLVRVTAIQRGHGMLFATSIELIAGPEEQPTVPPEIMDDNQGPGPSPRPQMARQPRTVVQR